jgi:trimeric autotransporter adhesin
VDRGAVYLYRRSESGAWPLLAVVKAPSRDFGDSFGVSVSLSASGRTLAVGALGEDSDATGIDGDRANENALHSGAAYLY